jgi:hypothetical protein
MSFFFQLLPFFNSENSELVEMTANRSVANRGKGIQDLNASMTQVI